MMGRLLHESIRKDNLKTVKNLLEQAPQLLKERSGRDTPLTTAALHAGDEMLRYLVEKVTDHELLLACARGEHEKVKQMVRRPTAGVNEKTADEKWNILHLAVMTGNVETVSALTSIGLKMFYGDYQRYTPLHLAARRGKGEIVKHLIEKGHGVDMYTRDGWTPLHHAAQAGRLVCVKLLIDGGANPMMPVRATRKTAIDLTTDPEMEKLLAEAMVEAGPPPELPRRDAKMLTRESKYISMTTVPRAPTKLFMTDLYKKALVIYDLRTRRGNPTVLVGGIDHPMGVAVLGTTLYITDGGTVAGKFSDGSIIAYNLATRRKAVLASGLSYPTKLHVAANGDVYFLECNGSSTSFPGRDQLCVLRKGANEKEVLNPDMRRCTSMAVDAYGDFYIGFMGRSIPGLGGRIERLSADGQTRETILKSLPSVEDLKFDSKGNLFVAASGEEPKEWSVFVVPPAKPYRAYPLHDGTACSVCILPRGELVYSGRGGILYSLRVFAWPKGVTPGDPVKPGTPTRERPGQEVF